MQSENSTQPEKSQHHIAAAVLAVILPFLVAYLYSDIVPGKDFVVSLMIFIDIVAIGYLGFDKTVWSWVILLVYATMWPVALLGVAKAQQYTLTNIDFVLSLLWYAQPIFMYNFIITVLFGATIKAIVVAIRNMLE